MDEDWQEKRRRLAEAVLSSTMTDPSQATSPVGAFGGGLSQAMYAGMQRRQQQPQQPSQAPGARAQGGPSAALNRAKPQNAFVKPKPLISRPPKRPVQPKLGGY